MFFKRQEGGRDRVEDETRKTGICSISGYVCALEQKPQRSQISCTLDWKANLNPKVVL